MTAADIFRRIRDERARQEALMMAGKFPFTCATPDGLTNAECLAVLMEEVGETARAVMTEAKLVTDGHALTDELIQVAAVVVAWLERR